MTKFCINCTMGDPLPHDERIGQVIYNALRPNTSKIKLTEENIKDYDVAIASTLFNIPDHEIKRIFLDRLWCDKCKGVKN